MPSTVGMFTNVPIAGDPIRSDWPGSVSPRAVHAFANVAARDAWASPPNGALCVTTDTNTLWQRVAAAWRPATGTVVTAQGGVGSDVTLSAVGTYDLHSLFFTAVPYATTLQVTATVGVGNLNAGVAAWTPSMQRTYDGTILNFGGSMQTPASNYWNHTTLVWQYAVPANSVASVKCRVNITALGGGSACYGRGQLLAVLYAI